MSPSFHPLCIQIHWDPFLVQCYLGTLAVYSWGHVTALLPNCPTSLLPCHHFHLERHCQLQARNMGAILHISFRVFPSSLSLVLSYYVLTLLLHTHCPFLGWGMFISYPDAYKKLFGPFVCVLFCSNSSPYCF